MGLRKYSFKIALLRIKSKNQAKMTFAQWHNSKNHCVDWPFGHFAWQVTKITQRTLTLPKASMFWLECSFASIIHLSRINPTVHLTHTLWPTSIDQHKQPNDFSRRFNAITNNNLEQDYVLSDNQSVVHKVSRLLSWWDQSVNRVGRQLHDGGWDITSSWWTLGLFHGHHTTSSRLLYCQNRTQCNATRR